MAEHDVRGVGDMAIELQGVEEDVPPLSFLTQQFEHSDAVIVTSDRLTINQT
jgi:hypothetical protein